VIPVLVYGIENLNLNIEETDRITNFEKQVIKKSLKFAPFHHTKLLFDALKLETMDEKITIIKMSFHLRLLRSNYTRMFTKELIKLNNGVPDSHSICASITGPGVNRSSKQILNIKKNKRLL